jgi:transcriptional regulator with XRE-family HTH domain
MRAFGGLSPAEGRADMMQTWRLDHDLTQGDMGVLLGLSAGHICRIEAGRSRLTDGTWLGFLRIASLAAARWTCVR